VPDPTMSAARGATRVVHLTSVHPRNDVRIFFKECRSLAAAGFDVTLVVADGQGQGLVDGVRIVDAGARAAGRSGRALLTAPRVFAAARRLHADIYHFHDPELMPWGLMLRLSGAKVVYDTHEHLPEDILCKHYLPAGMRTTLAYVAGNAELLAARGLSAVVGATPHILQRFPDTVIRSGVYNYPRVEESQQTRSWESRGQQACYVGGISINRGVREVVASAGLSKTRLVLAGPLWDGLTLEQLAAMPGWDRVSYRGIVPREQVADTMGSSRVGIVTFLPTASHLNALPNKMFEYMSQGIPVVASDFPLWRQIVEETGSGLCVNPADPAAIAAAVDRLAGDAAFGEACGRNGARAVAGEFNWSAQAQKLLDLYRTLQRKLN
jgi:glycosyltransferase involved in cell wall biosynthesis